MLTSCRSSCAKAAEVIASRTARPLNILILIIALLYLAEGVALVKASRVPNQRSRQSPENRRQEDCGGLKLSRYSVRVSTAVEMLALARGGLHFGHPSRACSDCAHC